MAGSQPESRKALISFEGAADFVPAFWTAPLRWTVVGDCDFRRTQRSVQHPLWPAGVRRSESQADGFPPASRSASHPPQGGDRQLLTLFASSSTGKRREAAGDPGIHAGTVMKRATAQDLRPSPAAPRCRSAQASIPGSTPQLKIRLRPGMTKTWGWRQVPALRLAARTGSPPHPWGQGWAPMPPAPRKAQARTSPGF